MNHKLRESPRPEKLRAVKALKRIGLPYRDVVAFYNPYHLDNRMQWLDFCVWIPSLKRMGVVLFDAKYPFRGTPATYAKAFSVKQRWLKEKGIPYLILNRRMSTDEYELVIRRWIKFIA